MFFHCQTTAFAARYPEIDSLDTLLVALLDYSYYGSSASALNKPVNKPASKPANQATDPVPIAAPEDAARHIVPPFLRIPLEIRLEIYKWVHLINPINKWNLVPSSSNLRAGPAWCSPAALAILDRIPGSISSSKVEDGKTTKKCPPSRPLCFLPTSLLLVNKQVYYESRRIPFTKNEFVFSNHLKSGLWTAHTFLQSLESWQRESIRSVKMEIWYHDTSERHANDWVWLCQMLGRSLRSLRLKISNPKSPIQLAESDVGFHSCDVRAQMWLVHGLQMMRQLEVLDVQLDMVGWKSCRKSDWCASMESTLRVSNVGRRRTHVSYI